jgi:isopenicillin N synthase-like dioxygenase
MNFFSVASKSVAEFSVAAHELSLEILGDMVEGLPAASREHFKEYLVEQSGTLRVNNYPVCPQPALHTGLPPHIDACVLTVLHQSADVAGLEVEKDGSWIGVQPRHDALVVIVGAIVQAKPSLHSILFKKDGPL